MFAVKRMKSMLAVTTLLLTLSGSTGFALAVPTGAEEPAVAPRAEVPAPALESVTADESITVEGTVEWVDLEGGFYMVDGWGLMGDEALFAAVRGKRVILRGRPFDGISIRQVPQIKVSAVMLPVPADRPLPTAITVNGRQLPADSAALLVDGVLMVPLRPVVEMAGGQVHWDPKERAVIVAMPDRKAVFWIDEPKAELNEQNVQYFTRNLIDMAKPPVLVNGRTLISAEALTRILGLYEIAGTDPALDLEPIK